MTCSVDALEHGSRVGPVLGLTRKVRELVNSAFGDWQFAAARWQCLTHQHHLCGTVMRKNTLNVSEKLLRGESLYSENGRYQLELQDSDGHFVLYDLQDSDTGPKKALWWSTHKDKGGRKTAFVGMQPDGNLVQRDGADKAMWHSNTDGHGQSYLVVQNDGNAVIYKKDNTGDTWCTETQLQYLVRLVNARIVGSSGLILENSLGVPEVIKNAEFTRLLPNGQLHFEFTKEPGMLQWKRSEFRGPVPVASATVGGADSEALFGTDPGPSATYVLKLTALKLFVNG